MTRVLLLMATAACSVDTAEPAYPSSEPEASEARPTCPPCAESECPRCPEPLGLPGEPGFWWCMGQERSEPGYESECFRLERTCRAQVEYYRKETTAQVTDCARLDGPAYCVRIEDPLRMRRLWRCSDTAARCRAQLERYKAELPEYGYAECERTAARDLSPSPRVTTAP